MTSVVTMKSAAGNPVDVQLHYDHLSGTALMTSRIGDAVLPSRYPSREAAAAAARMMVASVISADGGHIPPGHIRIWLR